MEKSVDCFPSVGKKKRKRKRKRPWIVATRAPEAEPVQNEEEKPDENPVRLRAEKTK